MWSLTAIAGKATSKQKQPQESAREESADQRKASFFSRKCRRHKTLFYGQAENFAPSPLQRSGKGHERFPLGFGVKPHFKLCVCG